MCIQVDNSYLHGNNSCFSWPNSKKISSLELCVAAYWCWVWGQRFYWVHQQQAFLTLSLLARPHMSKSLSTRAVLHRGTGQVLILILKSKKLKGSTVREGLECLCADGGMFQIYETSSLTSLLEESISFRYRWGFISYAIN